MGFRSSVARNTLANANAVRDWRIYADIAQYLIKIARKLYQDEDLGLDIENSVYALDATTIDLCLTLCPWALFRSTKSGIKLHTLLDLRGNIPSFLNITSANVHDVNTLDLLPLESGSFYIMDRAYLDFARLHKFTNNFSFFVIRAKSNLQVSRVYSMPVDRQTGLICDQYIRLTGKSSVRSYPAMLRRVKFTHAKAGKQLVFLTNNFSLPALTITELYRLRWQVELFFKWIKQHLRIKTFYGNNENAIRIQIWTAGCAFLLAAIARKKLGIKTELYTFLNVVSVNIFDNTPLLQLVDACKMNSDYRNAECITPK
jgi:transposase